MLNAAWQLVKVCQLHLRLDKQGYMCRATDTPAACVQGKADRLMLSAHMPSPSEALAVGLVDELVDADQLMDTAVVRVNQMLALPEDGRIKTKQYQRSQFSEEWTQHATHEAQDMFSLLELPSTMRGLEAMMQKLAGKKPSKL